MTPDPIRLRNATLADVPALKALIDASYAPFAARGIALPDVSGGLAEDIAEREVIVAQQSDEMLGVLVLSLTEDHAHLMNVAVSPAAQGQGVGKLLITEAEMLAIQSGATVLDLATHKDIPENIATYEHLGWHVTGREDARIFMSKPLNIG